MTYQENILEQITEAGEILLTSGAEVSRIEDTMQRMANVYGFIRTDVFSITSTLIVTAHTKDGNVFTISRRVNRHQLDMKRIEAVNHLSRDVCKNPLPLDALVERIDQIRNIPECSSKQLFLAYILVSASFALFFGGTWRDCIASIVCGIALYLSKRGGEYLQLQPIIRTILVSAVMSLAAYYMVWCGVGQNADKIIIANIMLLIPGVNLMTSFRDMILGDTITGLLGICEAVLQAFAIAMGCVLVLLKFGGVL